MCACAACVVHDGLLTLVLYIATCGRGEEARRAAAEAGGDGDDAELDVDVAAAAAQLASRAADEGLLDSRFVQRQADLALEARLKSSAGPPPRPAEHSADDASKYFAV